MSITSRVKKIFAIGEEYDEYEEYEEYREYEKAAPTSAKAEPSSQTKEKVIKFNQSEKDSEIVLVEPKIYGDAQVIADNLKMNKGVLINLHKAKPEVARRILDFVSGYIYSIEGDIKNAGTNIFMAIPSSYNISGSIEDNEAQQDLM